MKTKKPTYQLPIPPLDEILAPLNEILATYKMMSPKHGNFTSSEIWKLMESDKSGKGFSKPALTYIEEKRLERRLGRSLKPNASSRSASWGTFVQHRVTNVLLDTGCKPTKNIRRSHPTIPNWTGAEDYLREDTVGEVKCFELKNFCQTFDAAYNGYNKLKEECPEIFWQLVSNCILNGMNNAELTLYVPYKSELSAIREEAEESMETKIHWLKYADDDELPYLIKSEQDYYPNLSSFAFEIKEEDTIELTNRVLMANELLSK